MSELRELYREVILDHSKSPRNFGKLDDANRTAEGHNPLCGDRVTVRLKVADGVIQAVRFEGSGCAISRASASMMAQALEGKSDAEARALFLAFHGLVTGRPKEGVDLGKLLAFAGVSEFPMRVKCASLAWHTLAAALDGNGAQVSTE